MKLIIAYIQPEKLNAVKQALYERKVLQDVGHQRARAAASRWATTRPTAAWTSR